MNDIEINHSQMSLLATGEAAARLGLQPSTLEKWRSTGGGPLFVKLGRAVRYRITDLDAFTAERLRAHTAQRTVESGRVSYV